MDRFMRRKRNIYMLILALLTIVVGLSSVTFAYFVPESKMETTVVVSDKKVVLQSDDMVDGMVVLDPHQTKEIRLFVISTSDYTNKFKITYESSKENVVIYSKEVLDDVIYPYMALPYTVVLENYEDEAAIINLNVISDYIERDIIVTDNELKNE